MLRSSAVLFFLLSAPSCALAQAPAGGGPFRYSFNGNELHQMCETEKLGAIYYLAGVTDAESIRASEEGGWRICAPGGATLTQTLDIVCKFLGAHPESRHIAASSLAIAAISSAWPCK